MQNTRGVGDYAHVVGLSVLLLSGVLVRFSAEEKERIVDLARSKSPICRSTENAEVDLQVGDLRATGFGADIISLSYYHTAPTVCFDSACPPARGSV